MIAIQYARQGFTATVVCDVCQQRIDDGSRGVAVFCPGQFGRELLSVRHAHKGACQAAAVAKLRGKRNTVWEELVNHLQGSLNYVRKIHVEDKAG